MAVKVGLAFLLTIATSILAIFAVPLTYKSLATVKKDLSQQPQPPFINNCLVPCDTSGTKPVCGSDGKTYTSKKELLCYQACGRDVTVGYEGECKTLIVNCLIPCDPCQHNPICATDGKTYGCPNALTCYQMCGKKIDIDYYGNCTNTEDHYTQPVSRI